MSEPLLHLVLHHPTEPTILMMEGEQGRSLPFVPWRGRGFLPNQVPAIVEGIRNKYGLDVMVLRHLVDREETQVCEIELRRGSCKTVPNSAWIDPSSQVDAVTGQLHHEILVATEGAPSTVPWQNRGWLDQAEDWIRSELSDDWTSTSAVHIAKSGWFGSCLLRIEAKRPLYFKACYQHGASEVDVTSALAESHESCIPKIVASDPDQRWMIMEDFGTTQLDDKSPVEWSKAAEAFGVLQRTTASGVEMWTNMGCPTRDASAVMSVLQDLLDLETETTKEESLSRHEQDSIRPAIRATQEKFDALDASRLPLTLCQPDLRDGNVAVTNGSFVYYDWADTVISYPFIFAHRMIEYADPSTGPDARIKAVREEAIREGYMRAFSDFESTDKLRRLFDISGDLYPVYCAVWCHLNALLMEPADPYRTTLRGIARGYLRELLSRFQDGHTKVIVS